MVKKEVDKLFKVNFIREVWYSTWLANVVMVKKVNGKWRMCTDSIVKLVDGVSKFKVLSFPNANSGKN